ncbi:DUF948 domain-containing protein [Mariniluteicoccus endophyticus]
MTAGEIAGLIAAGAFLVLVGLCAVPLVKLGRVFDELRGVVRELGDGTTPILTELRGTVEAANAELEKLAVVTEDAATVSGHATAVTEHAAQVSSLVSAAVSVPLRPLAAVGRRLGATSVSPRTRRTPLSGRTSNSSTTTTTRERDR